MFQMLTEPYGIGAGWSADFAAYTGENIASIYFIYHQH